MFWLHLSFADLCRFDCVSSECTLTLIHSLALSKYTEQLQTTLARPICGGFDPRCSCHYFYLTLSEGGFIIANFTGHSMEVQNNKVARLQCIMVSVHSGSSSLRQGGGEGEWVRRGTSFPASEFNDHERVSRSTSLNILGAIVYSISVDEGRLRGG